MLEAVPTAKFDHDAKRWPPVRGLIAQESRDGWRLILYFAHVGDDPALVGFEVLAEEDRALQDVVVTEGQGLDPASFAQLARTLPMYVDLARAELMWDRGDRAEALEKLRTDVGRGRRGLPDKHYREIAAEYMQLVRDDDPHPAKTIAERRPVHKSRASRWVAEARRRGYITEEAQSAS